MIFYTADLHFHYAPLLSSRPFAAVEEMDEALIRNWNERVSPEDTVYLVGDIGYNEGRVPHELLSRLKGRKHLIRGNQTRGMRMPRRCTATLRRSPTSTRSTTGRRTFCCVTTPSSTASGAT